MGELASPLEEPFLPADLCDDLCCCVICFEPFTDKRTPKALPCLHTFCRECLSSSISAHKKMVAQRPMSRARAENLKNFSCPVCKEVIRIPDKGIDGFKDDFRIRKISEVLAKTRELTKQRSYAELSEATLQDEAKKDNAVDKSGDRNSDVRMLCDVCKYFDKESEAPVYCIECTKLMCPGCAEDHMNAAISKDHDIINASRKLPTESTCSEHSPEILKYFCQTCSEPVCMKCTYGEHHRTHDMVKLNEHTAEIKHEIEELLVICKEKQPGLQSTLSELGRLEAALSGKEKAAQKAILLRTLEEISSVRGKQAKMEAELDTISRAKYEELQTKKKEVTDIQDVMKMAETLVARGQDLQLVCIKEELLTNLKNVMDTEVCSFEEVSFTDLGRYEGLVADVEVQHREEGSTRSAILADIKSVVSQMRMFSVGRTDTKPELVTKVGKKGSEDGEFNFPSGVAILPSGDIAVADLHNHRIQIFDTDGNFKLKFGSPDFKPCGVAVNKDGNLAVTDCNLKANCIKIYTPEGEFKTSLGVGEFDYPFSVAINSKNRYVVSDPAINKITVINAEGGLHRRFGTRSKFCFYLTVNNRDEIVVSDWYNNCVKIFSANGTLLKKVGSKGIADGQLLIPLGVVTDRRGNILILDCKCGRLSFFSPDGKFMKQLIGQDVGIEFSRALALSSDGRLAITTGDNKREVPNELHIYQI